MALCFPRCPRPWRNEPRFAPGDVGQAPGAVPGRPLGAGLAWRGGEADATGTAAGTRGD